jgi:hypothetical protein
MTIAWYDPTNRHVSTDKNEPLFTPLGQLWPLDVKREWVGLTDAEVSKLIDNEIGFNSCCGWEEEYTRAVEAKLKERNA